MGQPLPLPKRIPFPDNETRELMKDAGINFSETDSSYVSYTLLIGWRLVDHNHRSDLPSWKCVDNNDMVRFTVTGSWKETYDNELYLNWYTNPIKHDPPKNNLVEYSPPANLKAVVDASGDKRPFIESVDRKTDYVPN